MNDGDLTFGVNDPTEAVPDSVPHPVNECDECGRRGVKIWRRWQGRRFCATCYQREFKKAACPRCDQPARLPRQDPKALCNACENAKACVRCGKLGRPIGLRSPYGPVCTSCAPFFRTAQPCEACGAPSRRLSRKTGLLEGRRLCERCWRSDNGTCVDCRKHRPLQFSADGRMRCAACDASPMGVCPVCQGPMPAGLKKWCNPCYWHATATKRVAFFALGVAAPAMQRDAQRFGAWLIAEVGAPKAAMTLARYAPFFREVDLRWGRFPVYEDLLDAFAAEGLRRVRLPMRWLAAAGYVAVDETTRTQDSERRRVQTLIDAVPSPSTAATVLHAYVSTLQTRAGQGKLSLRSIRLAITAAVGLLRHADPSGGKLPDQSALDGYLDDKPGQAACVTGFAGFLSRERGVPLQAKIDPQRSAQRRRDALKKKLGAAARAFDGTTDAQSRWTLLALRYFHGVSETVARRLARDATPARDGLEAVEGEHRFWVPLPNVLMMA